MAELIDRQAALKKMCETCGYCARLENAMHSTQPDFVSDKCNNYKFLAEQPTIEPEVRRGHWILIGRSRITKSRDLKCSVCGNYFRIYDDVTLNAGRGDANFCPNCGAKMKEDRDAGTD